MAAKRDSDAGPARRLEAAEFQRARLAAAAPLPFVHVGQRALGIESQQRQRDEQPERIASVQREHDRRVDGRLEHEPPGGRIEEGERDDGGGGGGSVGVERGQFEEARRPAAAGVGSRLVEDDAQPQRVRLWRLAARAAHQDVVRRVALGVAQVARRRRVLPERRQSRQVVPPLGRQPS